ncbi:MAG TPA: hypothetical protein VHD85_18755 [Terracidiphilus sp.]|nr:hypothetical protein [Terracidiphilus sp.]
MRAFVLLLNAVIIYLWFKYRWNLLRTQARKPGNRSTALWIVSCCFYVAYALGSWSMNH